MEDDDFTLASEEAKVPETGEDDATFTLVSDCLLGVHFAALLPDFWRGIRENAFAEDVNKTSKRRAALPRMDLMVVFIYLLLTYFWTFGWRARHEVSGFYSPILDTSSIGMLEEDVLPALFGIKSNGSQQSGYNKIMRCTFLLSLSAIVGLSSAFVAPSSRIISQSSSRADTSLAPQFDPSTEKWEPSSDADLEGSYSPVGTLIRAGPKPFLIRLVNPGEYEQAVYKYMANENVGRKEAQGNMVSGK